MDFANAPCSLIECSWQEEKEQSSIVKQKYVDDVSGCSIYLPFIWQYAFSGRPLHFVRAKCSSSLGYSDQKTINSFIFSRSIFVPPYSKIFFHYLYLCPLILKDLESNFYHGQLWNLFEFPSFFCIGSYSLGSTNDCSCTKRGGSSWQWTLCSYMV